MFHCDIKYHHKFSSLKHHTLNDLTVSVAQESRHSLTEPLAKLSSRCWPGLGSHLEAQSVVHLLPSLLQLVAGLISLQF